MSKYRRSTHWLVVDAHSQYTRVVCNSLVMCSARNVAVIETRSNCHQLVVSEVSKLQAAVERPSELSCSSHKLQHCK